MKFIYTRFDSLTAPIGRVCVSDSWLDFAQSIDVAVRSDILIGGWSATVFDGNRRAKTRAIQSSAIVLDFDEATENAQALLDRWSKYNCLVHTTKSNASHDKQRLRLVLPVAEPIPAARYPGVWRSVAAREPNCDHACCDVSRYWHWPSSDNPDFAQCIYVYGQTYLDPTRDLAPAATETALARIASAKPGQRNATLNAAVYGAVKAGSATPATLDAIRLVARSSGLDHSEIDRTIASATSAPQRAEIEALGSDYLQRGDHVEIAQRIVYEHPDLAHDGLGFLTYHGGVWHTLPTETVHKYVTDFAGRVVRTANGGGTSLKISAGTVKGVTELVQSAVKRNFAHQTSGVTFANCRLSVINNEIVLTTPCKDDLERHACDFAYDASAEAPKFREMLINIFDSLEDSRLLRLQEFAGACLFSAATKYQKCLMFSGEGGNGKSQLLTAIPACFPNGSIAALPPDSWSNDFRLASLIGKRLNAVNEMPEKAVVSSEKFKNVVTGEALTIDVKYREPVLVSLRAGHVLSANNMPATTDHSHGYFRRIFVIPLTKKFDKPRGAEVEIGDYIARHERPGVAAWCVEGMRRLLANQGYSDDPIGDAAAEQWQTCTDSVRMFCAAELTYDQAARHTTRELYTVYSTWARGGGYLPVSEVKFAQRLAQIPGVEYSVTHGRKRYKLRQLLNGEKV